MVSPEKRIGYGVALANLPLQPTSAATALAAERLIRWAGMIDVRQFISDVNPGRSPTRLGNDGIDPSISLPRRLTPALVARFDVEGITYRVQEHGVVDDDRFAVFVMLDSISFPQADPRQVQRILDEWRNHL
jgi:hypothetical protein